MQEIIKIVVSYLIPTILGTIIGFIVGEIKKSKKEDKALKDAVLALLRNELVNCFRLYETKGEISIIDRDNMKAMFEQYKNLGGNGTIKELMEELMELPTKIIRE
jgi:hypothetical protein